MVWAHSPLENERFDVIPIGSRIMDCIIGVF